MTFIMRPSRFETGSTLLFSDTFTDTDGTLLTAHTPDVDVVGGGWVQDTGAFTIESNELEVSVNTEHLAYADVEDADVVVEATTTYAANSAALMARMSDYSNFWMGVVTNGILFERVAGTFTERANVGTPSARPNTVSMECSGSSITLSMETGLSATYTSATHNQTATKHGVRHFGAATVDDFSVTSL